MYNYVRYFLITTTSYSFRKKLKRAIRHFRQAFNQKKTTIEDFRVLLTKTLGIQKGDWLFVTSSFGNLNADFSPQQAIEVLQSIVTCDGLIMMPYYPPMNSQEWAEKNYVFDMLETKSGMGILTNVFATMPNVRKSVHPTKAVCYWGNEKAIDYIHHFKSTTPFYWDSPYGELLKHPSKSLCLGVKNIPIVHSIEDILSEHFYDYYYLEKKSLKIRLSDKSEIDTCTYIHNQEILARCVPPKDYVKSINPPSYRRVPFGLKYVVVVDNDKLFDTMRINFAKGNTRFRK